MKKLYLLVLLLPCALDAATVKTCEVRARVTLVEKSCDNDPECNTNSALFSDGSASGRVICGDSPLAWDPVNGWTSHCDAIAAGDCFHAVGELTAGGCKATGVFAKMAQSYCDEGMVNRCRVRGVVGQVISTCPSSGPCYNSEARITETPSPLRARCDISPSSWDPVNGFTQHCQSMVVGDCVEAEGRIVNNVCEADQRFSLLHSSYCAAN